MTEAERDAFVEDKLACGHEKHIVHQEKIADLQRVNDELKAEIKVLKRAEEALRESEERFRAFVTASSNVVYRMSPDWREMHRLCGRGFLADTEIPNPTWLKEYIHPDDQPHVTEVINEAIRTKSVFQLEHRVLRADGHLGWTFSRAIPMLDENGEIVEWFGAASDITDLKQSEEALKKTNKFLTMAQRGSGSGVWDWCVKTNHLEWSPELFILFGMDPLNAVASFETWNAILHPDDKDIANLRIEP
jgi:PAS domain-containing protein